MGVAAAIAPPPSSSSSLASIRRQKSRSRVTSGRGTATATDAESSAGEFAFSIRAAPSSSSSSSRATTRPTALPPPVSYDSDIPMATLAPFGATATVSHKRDVVSPPHSHAIDHTQRPPYGDDDDGSEYERASRNADGGQRQREIAEALG
jgi:hypothetical protein